MDMNPDTFTKEQYQALNRIRAILREHFAHGAILLPTEDEQMFLSQVGNPMYVRGMLMCLAERVMGSAQNVREVEDDDDDDIEPPPASPNGSPS